MKKDGFPSKKTGLKIKNPWKFFLLVLVVYFFLFFYSPLIFYQALKNFWAIFVRVAPLLILVYGAIFLVNLFIKQEGVKKLLGKEAGIRGWLMAIIGGILISGPPYVLYPLLGEFKKQGARNSLLAVFLYNRNVKIPFVPVMIYYFGIKYTLVLSFLIIVFSLLNGFLVEALVQDSQN